MNYLLLFILIFTVGVDNCDTAWKTAKCYFEADLPNMMMIIEHLPE